MKYSKTVFNEKARKLLLKGAREVFDAVGTTLGARGRNVVIQKQHRTRILHDGVKVAEEINPKDQFKAAGAEILKQAAQRQVDEVGDGTTVAVVLGYAIASEALKIVESGVNPMALRSGLEKGRDLIIDRIRLLSKPIETKEQKIQVATVSSEDKQMGQMIGETYNKAGVDAVITAEEVMGPDTFIEHQEGMQIDSGYKAEYFVTNPKNMTASVSKANILITDYKLDDVFEIEPLFIKMNQAKEKSLVVIAEDIEGMVLVSLINNKVTGKANMLAIKAPSYQTKNVLQDIAIVVGAKFVSSEAKDDLREITLENLGYADRVISTKEATTIRGGGGTKKAIKERIASIKKQLKDEENEFQREKLRERLAKLTGGVYVIKVGGSTEVEAEERKERADDAILATKAAIQEGIVAGGEIVFLEALKVLKPKSDNEDYAYRILKNALKKPFETLIENAGLNSGELMAKINNKKFNYGVDVIDGKIKNMIQEGILDPTLVAIEAIKNSVSVAIALITSDAIVVEHEVKEK
jgi:chaperonin GroEL